MSTGIVNADEMHSISRRKLSKTGLILISLTGVYHHVEVMWHEDNTCFLKIVLSRHSKFSLT
jgi:hypothetical protein